MAGTAYYLSEQDVGELRDMLSWFRRTVSKERVVPFTPTPILPQSPEVYLAKVPPSGIPALTQSGTTGTGTEEPLDDIPGVAECEVYQLDTESSGSPSFERVGELTHYVYNLSPREISADESPWVTIHKDKFGEWFVGNPRSSNASDLEFQEYTVSFDTLTDALARECGLTFKKTGFDLTFSLPVGSSVSLSKAAGEDTGTGTDADANDVRIDYMTQLITLPAFPVSGTFDADTCTVTLETATQQVCVFSGGVECCPDYTGTGTS